MGVIPTNENAKTISYRTPGTKSVSWQPSSAAPKPVTWKSSSAAPKPVTAGVAPTTPTPRSSGTKQMYMDKTVGAYTPDKGMRPIQGPGSAPSGTRTGKGMIYRNKKSYDMSKMRKAAQRKLLGK